MYYASRSEGMRVVSGWIGLFAASGGDADPDTGPPRVVGEVVYGVDEPGLPRATVCIACRPWCDCADSAGRHGCRHIRFVLAGYLNVGEQNFARLDFSPVEVASFLRLPGISPAMFGPEPDMRSFLMETLAAPPDRDNDPYGGKAQRQVVDGECPICWLDLDTKAEPVVWCRAACGINMHRDCFLEFALKGRPWWVRFGQSSANANCPHCRAEWIFPGQVTTQERLVSGKGMDTEEDLTNISSDSCPKTKLNGRRFNHHVRYEGGEKTAVRWSVTLGTRIQYGWQRLNDPIL
ncbi:hypothetical protein B0I37DRAFT_38908 [Chaetomium sp. MPI-CAGE-AT-0009]|nr:hypothetical protein B0I37DRAFT_38908 [Chaetomium sp. MPI-CAGE-AT-0009]